MHQGVVRSVKQAMDEAEELQIRTIIIVVYSTNNLRDAPEGTENEVIKFYAEIAKFAEKNNFVHLVFSSLIPSYKTDAFSGKNFKRMNFLLKYLCNGHKKLSFFNGCKYLIKNGSVVEEYYKTDGIHLSELGGTIFAKQLSRFINALPRTIF